MGALNGDRIDSLFTGTPLVDLILLIEKAQAIERGEFETTLDFRARSALLLKLLVGDLKVDGLFAFTVPVRSRDTSLDTGLSGINYKYYPDSHAVSLYVKPPQQKFNGIGGPNYIPGDLADNSHPAFGVEYRVDAQETYEASNAFGAQVRVNKTSSTEFGIAATRSSFLNIEKGAEAQSASPAVRLAMDNDDAAKLLPSLKAVIVLRAAEPYLLHHFDSVLPTRAEPRETLIQYKFLAGDILGIVFYSGASGDVIARLPASFGK